SVGRSWSAAAAMGSATLRIGALMSSATAIVAASSLGDARTSWASWWRTALAAAMASVVRSSSHASARSPHASAPSLLGSTAREPCARAASTILRMISSPPIDVNRARRAAAPDVVREADLGALHLARARVPLELLERLDGLPRTRGAQRVPLGLEAAAGVDHEIVPERAALLAR